MKNVIISKQGKKTEQYERFVSLVKQKNTKVIVVKEGSKVVIEDGIYFDILWPLENQISENVLNNNSIVARLSYRNFNMLFTGDIEQIAETQILQQYKNTNILNSTVLKVAHHGSKTSSTQDFLEAVKAEIAFIGVGEKNAFGHPNQGTLDKLKNIRLSNL